MRKMFSLAAVLMAVVTGAGSVGVNAAFRHNNHQAQKTIPTVEHTAQTEVSRQKYCDIANCTVIEEHRHGACKVEGCQQTGEHRHGVCEVEGCQQTGEHRHGACKVEGCQQTGEHRHGACEVEDCQKIGQHNHEMTDWHPRSGGQHLQEGKRHGRGGGHHAM